MRPTVPQSQFGDGDEFRDLRISITEEDERSATAVAEVIHFERAETRILGIFPATS